MAYDLRDPAFLADPGPVLAAMRAEGELVRVRLPLIGLTWLTTTDAGTRELLKDTARFTRNPAEAGLKDVTRYFWWLPRFMHPLMRSIILAGGEDHKRLRGLVDRAFAKTSIEALEPQIAALADRLLLAVDPARPVDIIGAYSRALPLQVICALLGIADADRARITRWIAPIAGPTGPLTLVRALPGLWRVMRYFRADFARERAAQASGAPRPGLIGALVAVEAAGDRLSEDELLSLVFTLFVAGHETTVHLIDNGILRMIDHPGTRPVFAAGDARAALAVEEVMRHASPVMMTKGHFARADCDFRGHAVKRGEVLAGLLIAANHDPARTPEPGTFRADRRPNAHLGFGFGPHVCLGIQLARAEARIALARLATHHPNFTLAGPRRSARYARRLGLRGPAALRLTLAP